MTSLLRIAVPNKGRLEEPAAALLTRAGLRFERTIHSLSVPVASADIELLFVRTEDVPELVADGVAELGITGLDLLEEAGLAVAVLVELGFGRCRLVAAVPEDSPVQAVEDFAGLRVATSHPRAADRFFTDKGVAIATVPLRGSVEVAPKLEIADAVVDLVSSGSTMLVNGLRPVVTLLDSQAVLVACSDREPTTAAATVTTMIRSVVAAARKRYLLMNAPRSAVGAIAGLIPGVASPTVVPLADDRYVAIHSVVDADEVWQVLPGLEAAGASGILVLPIEQMIP